MCANFGVTSTRRPGASVAQARALRQSPAPIIESGLRWGSVPRWPSAHTRASGRVKNTAAVKGGIPIVVGRVWALANEAADFPQRIRTLSGGTGRNALAVADAGTRAVAR